MASRSNTGEGRCLGHYQNADKNTNSVRLYQPLYLYMTSGDSLRRASWCLLYPKSNSSVAVEYKVLQKEDMRGKSCSVNARPVREMRHKAE